MQAQKLLTCLFTVLMCAFATGNASAQYSYYIDGAIIAGNDSIGGPPSTQELGRSGPSDTAFDGPTGICADGSGNIYVADFYNNRVQRWHVGDKFGTTVVGTTSATGGSSNALLNGPTGVALDSHGNLFVSDRNNNRVMEYSSASISAIPDNGQITSTVSGTIFCGGFAYGSGKQDVNAPTGIFITLPDDSLYVAEGNDDTAGVYRVLRFPPGSSSGTLGTVVAGGAHSSGLSATPTNLDHPIGIYVNATTRDVYIADYGYHRVQEWSEPYTTGATVAGSTIQAGANDSLLQQPCGVWLDAHGNLLVTDYQNSRLMEYLQGDTFGIVVVGVPNAAGFTPDSLGSPYGICMDASGHLFLTDDNYQIAKEYTYSATGVKAIKNLIIGVELYPNPSMGSFSLRSTVDPSLNGKDAYIMVMDINGKVVFSEKVTVQNGSVNQQLQMGDKVPDGVYQLELVSGNNKANSKFEIIR